MGYIEVWQDFRRAYDVAQYTSTPRPLTDDDYDGWADAATKTKVVQPRTKTAIQAALKRDNFVRWHRLRGDVKWIKKRMLKMGLNPEDWKSLL